jgi:mannosyltransferase
LDNVTYYLRLDTDSYITEPLCSDPLDLLHAHNQLYGYISTNSDPTFVIHGMWDFVDDYAKKLDGVGEQMKRNGWIWPHHRNRAEMRIEEFPNYHNNFEMAKLDTFRRGDVQASLKGVPIGPERHFKWRWGNVIPLKSNCPRINVTHHLAGDAPLRYATVHKFLDVEKDVEQFCGFRYSPQGPQCPYVAY